jgi:hypothetical protein
VLGGRAGGACWGGVLGGRAGGACWGGVLGGRAGGVPDFVKSAILFFW